MTKLDGCHIPVLVCGQIGLCAHHHAGCVHHSLKDGVVGEHSVQVSVKDGSFRHFLYYFEQIRTRNLGPGGGKRLSRKRLLLRIGKGTGGGPYGFNFCRANLGYDGVREFGLCREGLAERPVYHVLALIVFFFCVCGNEGMENY